MGSAGAFAQIPARTPAAPAAPAMRVFQDPQRRFSISYPGREWVATAGSGEPVAAVLSHQEREAAVVIEYVVLNTPLAPEDITDVFGQIEADLVTERQPGVTGMRSQVLDHDGQRIVTLDYTRQGVRGLERVHQLSLPRGRSLFRIVCSAGEAVYAGHEATLEAIARSFTIQESPLAKPGPGPFAR